MNQALRLGSERARRLDGKIESEKILRRLKQQVAGFRRPVTLAILLIGDRFDSALYVKLKMAAAKRVGIKTVLYRRPASMNQHALEALIDRLNRQSSIDGILLQLPLPANLDTDAVVARITPEKDADGFHPNNSRVNNPAIASIWHLLRLAKSRKRLAVIVGKSSVFCLQLQKLLSRSFQDVRLVRLDPQWSGLIKQADAVVTILGSGPMLRAKHIKPGAVVIDVGIRKMGKKTVGDAARDVWKQAGAVSPVPGGIGPMTVAYVLANTFTLAKRRRV